MSACKWRKTMLFAKAHGVATETYAGLEVLRDQFFIQIIPESVWKEWAALFSSHPSRPEYDLSLLSPRLQKNLSAICDKTDKSSANYQLLEALTYLAYALLNDNQWVRQMMVTGELIRERGAKTDSEVIKRWTGKLHLNKMVQLEGALLVNLMGLQEAELPFEVQPSKFNIDSFASAIPHSQEQMQFSQGKDIFVHTSNKSAMVWNARRSARFFRYNPMESVANLFSSFAKSLTNIEE